MAVEPVAHPGGAVVVVVDRLRGVRGAVRRDRARQHARRRAPRRREAAAAAEPPRAPSAAERALWVALSAMGSCLLLAVTNHLTQNIASIPFLWVVPLSHLPRHVHPVLRPPALVPPRTCFCRPLAVLLPAMAWYSDSLDLWTGRAALRRRDSSSAACSATGSSRA